MKLHTSILRLSPVAVLLAVATLSAKADLSSQPVEVDYIYPVFGSVVEDLGTGTVTGSGFTVNSFGEHNFTVFATQLVLENVEGSDVTFTPAPFNGYQVTETGGSPAVISGVTLDGATDVSGVTASDVSFDGTHVWLNLQGITTSNGQEVVLDLTFAPEPGLMGIGLVFMLGIVGFARRARRTTPDTL